MPKADKHDTVFNLSFFYVFLLDFNPFFFFLSTKITIFTM